MIDREGDFKEVPSPVWAATVRYFTAWCRVATGAILAIYIDEMYPTTPKFATDLNMLERLVYLFAVTKKMAQTYLVGWCLMDVGPIACGLAFNGYDKETGKPKFDRVQSALLWKLEFSSSW